MRDQHHWSLRWAAEILVVLLLLVGGLTYRFDLADRLLGPTADPRTDPAAVAAGQRGPWVEALWWAASLSLLVVTL